MILETGKLYQCSEWNLLVYPSSEIALEVMARGLGIRAAWSSSMASPAVAVNWASYWSKELGYTVRCSEPSEIFMVIDHITANGIYFYHVVFGKIQGWIICFVGSPVVQKVL